MTDIITTLHPENDENTNLYPNIKKENIPNKVIDRDKLDDGVNNLLDSINELHPSGVDTSTNILAFTTDKGIYIGSDTGHWYYWNGSQYVDGGVFQAVELNDGSVTLDKLEPKIQTIINEVEKTLYSTITTNCYVSEPSDFPNALGPNQYWAYSLYIPSGCYLETINFYLSTYSALTFYLCELGDNNTLEIVDTIASTRYEEGNNTINHFYECTNDTYIVVGTSNRSGLQYKSGSDGIGRLNNYTLSGTTFTQTQSLNKWQLGLSFTYIKQKEESYTLKVAKDGLGDFTTINEALSYAYTIESKQNPVTILIYPGVYKEVCDIKGTHNISLVGINRNTCIIRDDSGIYNNAPLRIEGNCYIANLTLIATHNDKNDYVVNGVLNYNPSYALHIDDRHPDDDDDYLVTIFNCVCYSEQNSALGVGMDKKTTIQLIQCEFITNYTDDMFTITDSTGQWAYKPQNGAIFYHALYDGHYTDSTGYQRFMIKDCIMKSNIQYAIFGESGGLMQYVETTFINNVGYSANGFTAHRLSGETLQPLSYGNNITDLNYQP